MTVSTGSVTMRYTWPEWYEIGSMNWLFARTQEMTHADGSIRTRTQIFGAIEYNALTGRHSVSAYLPGDVLHHLPDRASLDLAKAEVMAFVYTNHLVLTA